MFCYMCFLYKVPILLCAPAPLGREPLPAGPGAGEKRRERARKAPPGIAGGGKLCYAIREAKGERRDRRGDPEAGPGGPVLSAPPARRRPQGGLRKAVPPGGQRGLHRRAGAGRPGRPAHGGWAGVFGGAPGHLPHRGCQVRRGHALSPAGAVRGRPGEGREL